jgi:hypothetical protein
MLTAIVFPPAEPEALRSRIAGMCTGCGADLHRRAHDPACPDVRHGAPWEIRRFALNPADRRLEDLLAEATRRAWVASERAGGRP